MTSTHTSPAVQLSGSEFLASVESVAPAVAVFDCDGTLWSGDAGYGFMRWSLEAGLVSRNASDWIDSRYRLYCAGEVSEEAMCGEMVQIYAGLREEEIRKAAAKYFAAHIEPHVFPQMEELLARLKAAGTEIWAVSSTNNWMIEAGVERFGIPAERVLAARVKVKAGVITSELEDVPTDDGKARSLRRVGVEAPDVVCGNSVHDVAMLAMARFPYAVNPTKTLLGIAAQNGWPVFYPEENQGLAVRA